MINEHVKSVVSGVGDRVGDSFLSPPHTSFGRYVNHGPRDRRVVALTFDDPASRPGVDTAA